MSFGLQPQEQDYITQKIVEPLRKLNLEVYCFGSRARGTHRKFSDLDLMIEGKKTSEAESLKSALEEILSKENFPFKVDLVFFDDYALAYQQNYLSDRVRWGRGSR